MVPAGLPEVDLIEAVDASELIEPIAICYADAEAHGVAIERIQADSRRGATASDAPAVFAVPSLKAVSFRFPLAPSQFSSDTVELVHAGLSKPA